MTHEFERIVVEPLTGALGAEITGVQLDTELDDGVYQEIRRALLEHLVIFFRDQSLGPSEHKAFGRRFGELQIDRFVKGPEGHPEIMALVKEACDTRNFAGMWHSDVTFQDCPAMGSILYARDVPEVGGDTLWSNMYLAYETLSPGLKRLLGGLRAFHCAEVTYSRERMDEANQRADGMQYTQLDPSGEFATHPVVRTHPETGRKALYVNCAFTRHFEGMTEEESAPLLQYLYDHLGRAPT